MKVQLLKDIESKSVSSIVFPQSFLQSSYWARFKSLYGWKVVEFVYYLPSDIKNEIPYYANLLYKNVKPFGSLCYVPLVSSDEFAYTDTEQGNFLFLLSQALTSFIPKDTFLIRFEPNWTVSLPSDSSPEELELLLQKRHIPIHRFLKKSIADIQPPDTIVLDLTDSEDNILLQMKSKWRYNCRLGLKKGLIVRKLSVQEVLNHGLSVFYSLYEETAQRDKIAIHSKKYYQDLFEISLNKPQTLFSETFDLCMYIAYHDSIPLASIIVLTYNKQSVYLYGASSNHKRNLMPAYALQWQAIRDAKQKGSTSYDFYGIPPRDDPNHSMHGLYRFKTGFGGSIVHRCGSYDISLNKLSYSLFRLAEILRLLWFKKIKKFLSQYLGRF